MKKIFTTALASVAILMGVQAQKYNMFLHFADGSKKAYHVENIDSVTFEEARDYSKVDFEIKVSDITSNGATTTVSCNTPDVLYYNEAFEKSYFDVYTPEELAQGQLEYMLEDWEQYQDEYKWEYGEDITFADFFYLGNYVDTYTYENLSPSTDYIVIAFAVDLNMMEVVGTPDTLGFTTIAPEPSDNVISFAATNDSLFVNTTNNDTYFWSPFTEEDLADYGVETYTEAWDALVAEAEEYDLMDYFTSEGSEAYSLESYFYGAPGTYTLVAAGWNGLRTTDYFTYQLTVTEEQVGGAEEGALAPAKKVTLVKKQAITSHKFHPSKKITLKQK